VVVNDRGKRRTISKAAAVLAQLVNKAAQGDLRAIAILVRPVVAPDEQDGLPAGPAARFFIER
jgi:hypothetical protein